MPDNIKYADKIPFGFILDHILRDDLVIKPMFGCYAVYVGQQLCLFLLEREKPIGRSDGETVQNGVYIATSPAHVAGLTSIFPDVGFQGLKGEKVWIFVPAGHPRFEDHVIKACEMITAADSRIGR